MKKLFLIIITVCLLSNITFAQNRRDIGFVYNTFSFNRINIDYRTPKSDMYKLKFGFTIGQSNSFNDESSNSYYTFANDSIITKRQRSFTNFQSGFKVGLERRLGSSNMFSIGADFIIAYRNERVWLYDNNYLYVDSLNIWTPEYTVYPENYYLKTDYYQPLVTKVNRTYIVPQLQVNFLMDIPISKDLFLNLFIGGLFGTPILLQEKNKYDPQNELPSLKNVHTFEMTSQAGIGLRYSIGKEKEFAPKTEE